MKLWLGSETQADVYEIFRVARISVESSINAVIENKTYDVKLGGWDCIAILRDDTDLKEIVKYSPKKEEMDFRLVLDYDSFKNGDEKHREKLVFDLLLRSLDLLEEKGLSKSGIENLRNDVKNIGLEHGWL